jgi:hypothetical protein
MWSPAVEKSARFVEEQKVNFKASLADSAFVTL